LLQSSSTWDRGQQYAFQLAELKSILSFASRHVPYYRRLFREIGCTPGDFKSLEDLRQLPLLTREMVCNLGTELLAHATPANSFKYSTTAGTSGKPLGFYITHDASAREWAFMLKNWERAGFRPTDKRVVLRGRLIRTRNGRGLWEHDPVNRALYVSSFDLSNANLGACMDAITAFRPDFVHAYPSSATVLAQYLERTGKRLPSLRGVLLGSENLYSGQREYLEKVFGVRVFSWYGHSEKCILAGECEKERDYHLFPQYGIAEIVDSTGNPIDGPGRRGQLVGTGFINRATLFVRYLTDDEAEWSAKPCACGRHSRRICNVRGRWNQEFLVGRSGTLIPIAAVNLHTRVYTLMRQFQFCQDSPGRVLLRVVRTPGYAAPDEALIREELLSRLEGEVDLKIEHVEAIDSTSSGKFKFVDQRIPIDYPQWDAGERA
jgi:phenylacetate-CoA ligase